MESPDSNRGLASTISNRRRSRSEDGVIETGGGRQKLISDQNAHGEIDINERSNTKMTRKNAYQL